MILRNPTANRPRQRESVKHAEIVLVGDCTIHVARLLTLNLLPEVCDATSSDSSSGSGADCREVCDPMDLAPVGSGVCGRPIDQCVLEEVAPASSGDDELIYVCDPRARRICPGDWVTIMMDDKGQWWIQSINTGFRNSDSVPAPYHLENGPVTIAPLTYVECGAVYATLQWCTTELTLAAGTEVCGEVCPDLPSSSGSSSSSP